MNYAARKRNERILKLIEASISRIDKQIEEENASLEESAPSINIKADTLAKVDANKVADLAKKATINITEDEENEINSVEVRDGIEDKKISLSQQEEAIFNLKNWVHDLKGSLDDGERVSSGAIKFVYSDPELSNPINILVYINGLIRMSGQSIQDFTDFKNIINFHRNF
jgi:hypothetical protein